MGAEEITFNQVVENGVKLGTYVAQSTNGKDHFSAMNLTNAFLEGIEGMPPVYVQAAVTAFATAYAGARRLV